MNFICYKYTKSYNSTNQNCKTKSLKKNSFYEKLHIMKKL